MQLPRSGASPDEILGALEAMRANDVRWREGRTFGLVYDGGDGLHALQEQVAQRFLQENALNTGAFPSLGRMQSEVVSMVAHLLHGEDASGFITSGGTESILMAVKSARERGRIERGITEPEMIVPESAHAAFHKAAHYFGLTLHKVAVQEDWRADVGAMAERVTDNTVLMVGSAPQYPQGVINPIEELAAVAAEAGASFHTDACMGGFVLPFMESMGDALPLWDFRVPGVTSISADLHKLGYVPKGASTILHRSKDLRRHQTFVFDGWLGGFYASPSMQGTRSGLPIALAWATLSYLGLEGYQDLTRQAVDACRRLTAGVRAIPALTVLGEPEAHLFAMTAAPGAEDQLDVFALADELATRGWFQDRQTPPDSLHSTVSAGNAPVVDDYLADLADAVATIGATSTDDRSTSYATLE